MFRLKPLSKEGIEAALRKAERYRLLNEPWEAESICRDVREVDAKHQEALVTLLLALTDQFALEWGRRDLEAARALLPRLQREYEREYYAGIIAERWAKRLLAQEAPGTGAAVYRWLEEAMRCYERAERLRPTGEDDAILRWNTCARLIMRHEHVRPAPADEGTEPPLE